MENGDSGVQERRDNIENLSLQRNEKAATRKKQGS
jgi:hypothetical protein